MILKDKKNNDSIPLDVERIDPLDFLFSTAFNANTVLD
jgi:hypothetical protein